MAVRPSPQTDRVVAVLDVLASSGPMALSDIARRVDVNKSTMYSLLFALTRTGWLIRDPAQKTYYLGPQLISIGRAASEQAPVLALARPVMLDLVEEYQVSCLAYRRLGSVCVLVDAIHRNDTPLFALGQQFPIRAPFGAILVAWDPREEGAAWCDAAPDATNGASPEHLAETLEWIRRHGYSVKGSAADEPDDRLLVGEIRRLVESAGADHTPEFDEYLRRALANLPGELLFADDHPPAGLFRVTSIDAAVRDVTGRALLAVQLGHFPRPLDRGEITRIATRLRDDVNVLSATLGAHGK